MSKYITVFTKNGRLIKVAAKDLPAQNRGGIGIKAITLKQGDEIVAAVSSEE